MNPDHTLGFDEAPARYTAQGRETIDDIRDKLGDAGFRCFCVGTYMRYDARAGLKGSRKRCEDKARWYRQMVAHLDGLGLDPRHRRPDFEPYVRGGPLVVDPAQEQLFGG